ncbi:glucan biosynthesis protein [Azohydromonas caseinilytica]|uniref:Glucan biosynthesis protein D n=1 Tax=Azohydromonas caseinilytica TaxID=2728836 RepID=A0A848FHN6_9BURK|nr:glucan biosynthesis protein D [Azohydromonas caseinilytica]NML18772.1 glucan biosynthesis protein D [Azohydromonas caseinilytica]
MHRRQLVRSAAALAAFSLPASKLLAAAATDAPSKTLPPQPFDHAWLKGLARARAAATYQAPSTELPREVATLDYDQYQSLSFRDDHALWAGDAQSSFRLKFFHRGLFFKSAVRMHEVVNGQARELLYDPGMFDYARSGLRGARLPSDLGFAGFRVNFQTDWRNDVAAFLGASYFRAVGGERQYGLSARGLAIDTGLGRPEEFPQFTDFWFERPAPGHDVLTVYALIDSPSLSGAYRFDIRPGNMLVMDVDAALYPRRAVERLGIAPLTSMYQHGENDRRMANDWRPEIHDSDGLALWTGHGEWLWRPLTNPAALQFSAFGDANPRGFGLLQRDRDFNNYQDDGVFYERRPSLWVTPKAGWGQGAVNLVEIPTDDETNDNIVAFWNPAQPLVPGEERLFSYQLHWGTQPPVAPRLAQVVATRTGIGGVVGRPRSHYSTRFAIDFAGGDFGMLSEKAALEPVISASRGTVEITSARPLASVRGWRAMFDLRPADSRPEPVELRLFLRHQGRPMTETWCYQWTPPAAALQGL